MLQIIKNPLVVIIGAGASYDCVSRAKGISVYNDDYRPPLVQELFAHRNSFNKILDKYPRVKAASDEIRIKLSKGSVLESFLKEMQERTQPEFKKTFYQIPLYLQELVGEISHNFVGAGSGNKFATLVSSIARSKYDHVMYVTLNYDLFLDDALSTFYSHKFSEPISYTPQTKNWDLIKLHGSVNWGKKVLNFFSGRADQGTVLIDSIQGGLKLSPDFEIISGHQDFHRFENGKLFYPAMTIPIKDKSGFVCGPNHEEVFHSFLNGCENFLIIGFSALDGDILESLKLVQHVRRLRIVNGVKTAGREAFDRIQAINPAFKSIKDGLDPIIYPGGFADFMESDNMERFFELK